MKFNKELPASLSRVPLPALDPSLTFFVERGLNINLFGVTHVLWCLERQY